MYRSKTLINLLEVLYKFTTKKSFARERELPVTKKLLSLFDQRDVKEVDGRIFLNKRSVQEEAVIIQ